VDAKCLCSFDSTCFAIEDFQRSFLHVTVTDLFGLRGDDVVESRKDLISVSRLESSSSGSSRGNSSEDLSEEYND